MHEDGLADCADGFLGGATRERKLEIMADSRIGTFGAVALVLSLYLRAVSLTLIVNESLGLACTVLIGAAALSRAGSLMPLALLPPARENGAGFAAGKPERAALAVAGSLAVVVALAPVVAGATPVRTLVGIAAATGAAYAVVLLARKHLGGQTGDVAGAAQQLSEIADYLTFAAGLDGVSLCPSKILGWVDRLCALAQFEMKLRRRDVAALPHIAIAWPRLTVSPRLTSIAPLFA